MLRIGLIILLFCVSLPARAEMYVAITDRDSFLLRLEGKKLTQWGRWMRFDDLGQIKGRVWGRPLLGNWTWQGERLCKRVFHGTIDQGKVCVAVRSSRTTVYFVPDPGLGERERFIIE